MKEELKCTKNYDMFSYKRLNRPVNLKMHKKLFVSMQKVGFLKSFPLTVKRENGKYEILDGQHRYAIAKQLGLSIYYVVIDKELNVAELNSTPVVWSVGTYVDAFATANLKDYILIKEYRDRYHFSIGQSAALLGGTVCCSNILPRVKDGSFKVKEPYHAEKVGNICNEIYPVYKKARDRTFVDAICAICHLEDVDLQRLIDNAKKHSFLLKTHVSRRETLLMLEGVYNYYRRPMYPLAINALNAMRDRHACIKKEDRKRGNRSAA